MTSSNDVLSVYRSKGFVDKDTLAAKLGVLPQTIDRRACPSVGTVERVRIEDETLYRAVGSSPSSNANQTTSNPNQGQIRMSFPKIALNGVHITEVRDNPNFIYHSEAGIYLVRIGGKTYEVSRETHESIRADYSNDGGSMTIKELAALYGRTEKWMAGYIRASGITHSDGLFSDETLAESKSALELLARERALKAQSTLSSLKAKAEAQIKKNSDLWLRREAASKRFLEDFNVAAARPVKKLTVGDSKLTNFSLFFTPTDFHYGKYAHSSTCKVPYNRYVARNLLEEKTQEIANAVLSYGTPEFTYIGVGSDWFHIDNYDGTTTKGTPQDIDGTPEIIFCEGLALFLDFVDMVRQFSKTVVLVYMPGNHDRVKSLDLYNACHAHYRNSPDVLVEDPLETGGMNPVQVNYYGKNIIVTAHGDRRSLKSTKFFSTVLSRIEKRNEDDRVFVFTGDKHHDRTIDEGGVHIEQMISLSGDDRWHTNSGWVGSTKGLCGYILCPDRGLMRKLIAPALPGEYASLFDESNNQK